MFDFFWNAVTYDIGIDLGTANTMVYVKGKGILFREPSVVAQHQKTKKVLAIGEEAKKMIGKTPASIIAIKPLSDGVISDFDITEQMLRYYIRKVHDVKSTFPKIPRPRLVIGVPAEITEVERKAVIDAATKAGAREVFLVEEPMASAIGAGLAVEEPTGNMIIDIGGGTTEIAIISLGGIVVNHSVRVAGNEMDQEIINFAKKDYNLLLGERTAEDIKIEIGSVYADETWDKNKTLMRGRDLVSGLPKAISITASEVRKALLTPVNVILSVVKDTIEETPPELLADLMKQGITLAGGGSLIRGMDKLLSERTGVPVQVADDPLTCVVRGTAIVLDHLDLLEKIKIDGKDL